jgi:hypothetical protein
MHIFPDEYKPHVSPIHRWAIIFSGTLILAGLTGIVLLTVTPSDFFGVHVRKLLGGMIVFGIPAGLILLVSTIALVSRRYNKKRKEALGPKESAISSTNQRANIIRTIAHLKYDYRNASIAWFKTSALLIVPSAIIGTLLIINDPEPAHALFIGILFLCGPLCIFGFGWLILIKPKSLDYIELTVDGILYQMKGCKAFLPWYKAKEIQIVRGGYSITSDDSRLIIWSDIEPSDIPNENFFAGSFRAGPFVRELIQSIKALAPHIYEKESFLARDSKLPIPNKVIIVFLVVLMLLFFLVIIRAVANI